MTLNRHLVGSLINNMI